MWGYTHKTKDIHALAGLVDERPTRYALGKGRVKSMVVNSYYKAFITMDDFERGCIDAMLDSIN